MITRSSYALTLDRITIIPATKSTPHSSPTTTTTTPRDWSQIYSIYGLDTTTLLLSLSLLLLSLLLTLLSLLLLLQHHPILFSISCLLSMFLFMAALNLCYSAGPLRWEMGQRVVGTVREWGSVRKVLDVGCGGGGMLLNAVALRLKKEGGVGRVVGVGRRRGEVVEVLRTAGVEGVQEYVTCREGDVRRLPFRDDYFDVVVSGTFLHRVGKVFGHKTPAAASAERVRVLGEVVRVLKPGGVGVVWDLMHVPEYVRKLRELRMEDVRVSERVTAFLVGSHIVSFRKPKGYGGVVAAAVAGEGEVRLDWRSHDNNDNNNNVINIC